MGVVGLLIMQRSGRGYRARGRSLGDGRRVLPLRHRLLAAVRRRHSRAPLPVPILPFLAIGFADAYRGAAGDHRGAGDPLGPVDAGRHAHLSADRRAGHAALGRASSATGRSSTPCWTVARRRTRTGSRSAASWRRLRRHLVRGRGDAAALPGRSRATLGSRPARSRPGSLVVRARAERSPSIRSPRSTAAHVRSG